MLWFMACVCVLDACIMEIWEIYNPFSLCGQGILVQSFIQGLYSLMPSDMLFLGQLRYLSFYDSSSLCFLMEQQVKDTADFFIFKVCAFLRPISPRADDTVIILSYGGHL